MSDSVTRTLEAMQEAERTLFLQHLYGGTSSEWLADIIKRHNLPPVSATTLKQYRRETQGDAS